MGRQEEVRRVKVLVVTASRSVRAQVGSAALAGGRALPALPGAVTGAA